MPDVITDNQVARLLPPLAEAARATNRDATRFVPSRTGIVEETSARRHQFIFGRRGVGKSSLLRKIESLGREDSPRVVFVDIEKLARRPYPDVLIELLSTTLCSFRRNAHVEWAEPRSWIATFRARRSARRLERELAQYLDMPLGGERVLTRRVNRSGRLSITGWLGRGKRHEAGAEAHAGAEREKQSTDTIEYRSRTSKMEILRSLVPRISDAIERFGSAESSDTSLLVLDDFYHVPRESQPEVLTYLHQVTKNTHVFLKICGVRHKIRPFVEGDPPTGLQLGHDAGEVRVDLTLAQFEAARTFLIRVLEGICGQHSVEPSQFLTDGGHERAVLGSGGVARDYLFLIHQGLRTANERQSSDPRPHNRITAEDINIASAKLSEQKQEDLKLDVGDEADQLRDRMQEIARFCLDTNGTNVFLVESIHLQETGWGREIQALADLRFVHVFGDLSVQTGAHRGRRFIGFTLDLSHYTTTRSEKIKRIDFWKKGDSAKARRARLIYEPERAEAGAARVHERALSENNNADEALAGDWNQGTFDGFLE
ncbi:MAG: hypothetical protein AAFQ53_07645 [Bacteroidota bacterium]